MPARQGTRSLADSRPDLSRCNLPFTAGRPLRTVCCPLRRSASPEKHGQRSSSGIRPRARRAIQSAGQQAPFPSRTASTGTREREPSPRCVLLHLVTTQYHTTSDLQVRASINSRGRNMSDGLRKKPDRMRRCLDFGASCGLLPGEKLVDRRRLRGDRLSRCQVCPPVRPHGPSMLVDAVSERGDAPLRQRLIPQA